VGRRQPRVRRPRRWQRPAPAGRAGDRSPVLLYRRLPPPLAWTGERELTMLIADHGGLSLHQARLGETGSRQVVGGDIQVDGFSARVGRPRSFSRRHGQTFPARSTSPRSTATSPSGWTHLNDDFVSEVELAPVKRQTIMRPDGTEVEYFTIAPPGRAERRLPLHLDIHGGPPAAWPSGYFLALHQAIAAAGYLVLLPNPRGSSGYGQRFTAACTGDWGGADYEDILACCEDLVERGIADRRRMFLSAGPTAVHDELDRRPHRPVPGGHGGGGRGGRDEHGADHRYPRFLPVQHGRHAVGTGHEYEKRSPLHYVPNVTTPRARGPLGGRPARTHRPGRGALHRLARARQGGPSSCVTRAASTSPARPRRRSTGRCGRSLGISSTTRAGGAGGAPPRRRTGAEKPAVGQGPRRELRARHSEERAGVLASSTGFPAALARLRALFRPGPSVPLALAITRKHRPAATRARPPKRAKGCTGAARPDALPRVGDRLLDLRRDPVPGSSPLE